MISGTEPRPNAMTGVPFAIASTSTSPNGFRPINREQQRHRIAEKTALLVFADLADKFEQRIVEQWQDCILEVVAVDGVDFRSNLQRQTDFARDGDCLVETFLGRYPAEKSEIPARPVAEAMQIARQPVLHRAVPVGPAERRPL